jgi:iron complex outermembrane receptor protein
VSWATPPRRLASAALGALLLVAAAGARAEEPNAGLGLTDTEIGRSPRDLLEAPLAISTVSSDEFRRGRPAIGLDEALDLMPGVFTESARNFAQDSRVAIRGFGSTATFGVRGIKILVDGVPVTLPDGQSETDSIDLAFADRIEVVRGPISSLWGGGAGGLISVSTAAPTAEPHGHLRTLFGTDHLFRQEALATGTLADTGYVVGFGYTRFSGYRDHSNGRQANLLAKLRRELSDGTAFELAFGNLWGPEAQDPGGLTRGELDCCRTNSAPNSRLFDTGERVGQQQVSLRVHRPLGETREIWLTGYFVDRDFQNSLPIPVSGRVSLDRRVGGGSLVLSERIWRLRFLGGVDADLQDDLRRRFDNDTGAQGQKRVDQAERVRALGSFGEVDFDLGADFGAVAGLRWDWTEFVIGDRFVLPPPDEDDSDRLHFRELSPRFGLYWGRSDALRVYTNVSTAFRVPTTTELSPNSLLGGFDDTLDPEKALGYELGFKGIVARRVLYDVALFQIGVRDALVIDNPTLQSVSNAGRVRRRGVETGLSLILTPWLSARAAYTWADYRYVDYDRVVAGVPVDFDGEREPNTPVHSFGMELRADLVSGLWGTIGVRATSDLDVNDANLEEADGATVVDARAGYRFRRAGVELAPFVGLRNLGSVDYVGSIRPNATFGRYYEPAPETEIYAGIQVGY